MSIVEFAEHVQSNTTVHGYGLGRGAGGGYESIDGSGWGFGDCSRSCCVGRGDDYGAGFGDCSGYGKGKGSCSSDGV